MELDLAEVIVRVDARAESWRALGLVWGSVQHSPEDGRDKFAVRRSFEAREWTGDLIVWVSGEAELGALGTDRRAVAKHYDFERVNDFERALDELAALVSDGSEPLDAHTWFETPR